MTATSDFMLSDATSGFSKSAFETTIARSRSLGCPLMRAMTSFFGVTLMASAVGVWVVSGVGIDMQLVLFKLVLTLVFFISGLSLTLSARRRVHPEVHLDNAKSELRVMERGCDGVARLKAAISYSEIQDVDFRDGMLCATGENGEALLEMPMGMIDNLDHLQAALGQSFNRVA